MHHLPLTHTASYLIIGGNVAGQAECVLGIETALQPSQAHRRGQLASSSLDPSLVLLEDECVYLFPVMKNLP